MKISSIRSWPVTVPSDRGPMSYFFLRVDTDAGVSGYGEACDSYGCSYGTVLATLIDDVYAPLLIGQEVTAAPAVAEQLRLATRRRLGDAWVAVQARSAVEIALWDLLGRAAGRSVSDLIGRVRDRVAVYASAAFLEEGPADWHADQLRPILDRGVRMVKLRVGPDWRADLETLARVRDLLGPGIEVAIDGSETYTLPTAREIARRLADLGVVWFEEPMPQGARAGIQELARCSPVPLAYGEHLYGRDEAIGAIRNGELSVLQADAATTGGIEEARQMALLGAHFGVRVVPHNCAGPLALAANLHVAATIPAVRLLEYPINCMPAYATLSPESPTGLDAIVDGELAIPDGPGLGMTLDESALAANPYQALGRRVAGTLAGVPDRFVGDR
ncbi:mandelate racemase/muconate lactonizing enzyme family protein [Dactylosporangium sp. CA-233914]|uniref:mandelate racemase/muconate lactonizing enzyme family protein n=1 Tax=Dactylosporangium sp. CA-233914 TaxID=3239934 RepID=UPI003D91B337